MSPILTAIVSLLFRPRRADAPSIFNASAGERKNSGARPDLGRPHDQRTERRDTKGPNRCERNEGLITLCLVALGPPPPPPPPPSAAGRLASGPGKESEYRGGKARESFGPGTKFRCFLLAFAGMNHAGPNAELRPPGGREKNNRPPEK